MSSTVYLVPQWFFGIDIALEILFAFVAGLIAYYAFKIYRLGNQRESELLGAGFLLIAISYIVRALLNIFVLSEASGGYRELSLARATMLGMLGIYIHFILFTAGLITLVYMTGKVKSERLYSLLLITTIILILMSNAPAVAFDIVSSVFVLYVFGYYIGEYPRHRNKKTLMIAGSFGLLFVGNALPLVLKSFGEAYVISHILELISYSLLFLTLFFTLRSNHNS